MIYLPVISWFLKARGIQKKYQKMLEYKPAFLQKNNKKTPKKQDITVLSTDYKNSITSTLMK